MPMEGVHAHEVKKENLKLKFEGEVCEVKHNGKAKPSKKKTKRGENENQTPRGTPKVYVLGSDSDNCVSVYKQSFSGGEESPSSDGKGGPSADSEADAYLDWSYGNLNWRKMLGNVKKSSPSLKFSSISMLVGYGLTKKGSKKGRKAASVDAFDCGKFLPEEPSWRTFCYEELKQATDDFSFDKLIGEGGHAEVYKGFLSDGQTVAVKKVLKVKMNDEEKVRDFLDELGIMAHLDHPNIVRLIGFSTDGGLFLVLQFSPHGSLATALHGSKVNLDWKVRYKLALGVAEGMKYLHYDCHRRIIHRDITASNILLSEDFEPQISDFGLAKWLPESWANLVISPIEGTFGYMAPEYFMHGIVHEKSDTFAFGVLLLELITGRQAVIDSSKQSLALWAKPFLEQNNVKEIVDPRLGENYDIVEMKHAMYTALLCINHLPDMHPDMKRVVQLLKGENDGIELMQRSTSERALMLDASDIEDYTSSAYLKDLHRHMELIME